MRRYAPTGVSVRRLAKQTRKDAVRSNRDYQEIQGANSALVSLSGTGNAILRYSTKGPPGASPRLVCAGGYVKAGVDCSLEMKLTAGTGSPVSAVFHVGTHWTRIGVVGPVGSGTLAIDLVLPVAAKELCIWGLDAGPVGSPDGIKMQASELGSAHLVPETFYLDHGAPVAVAPTAGWLNATQAARSGDVISLKKCAYCQRALPIDPKRPASLAFHKHNAKRTGHQNECRACKKWRINDDFNPKRTADQLHESSAITRERKLLLREPEVLQGIKDRQGAGLKSIVWERFDKRCFRCGVSVALAEVELDHTRPLAYLWPIDEHATCLCAKCNNHKKERFPVDVYTRAQLQDLARLTGLSLGELLKKGVCQAELDRIRADITGFARSWSPSTFNATARKVREFSPNVDLFEELKRANRSEYARIRRALRQRPKPVGSADD